MYKYNWSLGWLGDYYSQFSNGRQITDTLVNVAPVCIYLVHMYIVILKWIYHLMFL